MANDERIILAFNQAFVRKSWSQVNKGDQVYFQIISVPSDRFFGPYEVIDPNKCQLKLTLGITCSMPNKNVQLLKPCD
jgi:hypothetical protein